ncbi:MAG: GNAT family N-acetyltransferase [Alphaproteobacteria bacterium]|nr:GNAT family N-acetyltransferase [Alphaproteobacteria bacterium]
MKKKKNLKISCRKASLKDLEGICQLRSQSANDPEDKLTTEYASYDPKIDNPWIQKCLRTKQRIILIAEDTEGICAHSIVAIENVPKRKQQYYTYQKKALIVHLYVAIKKRHQGIGKTLLSYTLKFLEQQGVDFVELDCYIGNTKADSLYKKLGFKDIFIKERLNFK